MIIQVTQRDIDYGKQGDCFCCPIANALDRVLFPGTPYSVWGYKIKINGVGYKAGQACDDFVFRFDDGQKVSPFEFELAIPDELLRPEFRSSAEPSSVASSNGYICDHEDKQ